MNLSHYSNMHHETAHFLINTQTSIFDAEQAQDNPYNFFHQDRSNPLPLKEINQAADDLIPSQLDLQFYENGSVCRQSINKQSEKKNSIIKPNRIITKQFVDPWPNPKVRLRESFCKSVKLNKGDQQEMILGNDFSFKKEPKQSIRNSRYSILPKKIEKIQEKPELEQKPKNINISQNSDNNCANSVKILDQEQKIVNSPKLKNSNLGRGNRLYHSSVQQSQSRDQPPPEVEKQNKLISVFNVRLRNQNISSNILKVTKPEEPKHRLSFPLQKPAKVVVQKEQLKQQVKGLMSKPEISLNKATQTISVKQQPKKSQVSLPNPLRACNFNIQPNPVHRIVNRQLLHMPLRRAQTDQNERKSKLILPQIVDPSKYNQQLLQILCQQNNIQQILSLESRVLNRIAVIRDQVTRLREQRKSKIDDIIKSIKS